MNDSSLPDRCRLFLYVFCNLFFPNWKVICDNIPYDVIVYLKILVNYVISHAIHQFPRSVGMRIAKFFCKHIRGFAKNLDILNYGIIHHIIIDKITKSLSFSVSSDSFYSLKDMFKSAFISNSFSHTLRFYLVLQILLQKAVEFHQKPNQLFCLIVLPDHSTFQRISDLLVCFCPKRQ